MSTYASPGPITVTVEIGVGNIRLVASDRADTTVEVRPGDPAKKRDVAAAEATRVDFSDGRLWVRGPKGWRQYSWVAGSESIEVEIALPSGSEVRCDAGAGLLRTAGVLGACTLRTGAGEIRVDRTGTLEVRTGAGDIAVEGVTGHAEVRTGAGSVRIGSVDGSVAIRNSYGETWVGRVAGDARVRGAHGAVRIDRAEGTLVARTSSGDIRVGEASEGTVDVQTAYGGVEVGVREGVAAWLDLDTRYGSVSNRLEASEQPAAGERSVEVRARTAFGTITVRRSYAGTPATVEA